MPMFSLEKYQGQSSRHSCPNCGQPGVFVRYVDEHGEQLESSVGRCNREVKCGYHRAPREHFAESSGFQPRKVRHNKSGQSAFRKVRKPDSIRPEYLIETLSDYDKNPLVLFLLKRYSNDPDRVHRAINKYFVGTLDGYTVFPRIDRSRVVRSAKLIKYDSNTGKRIKDAFAISSLQAKLKYRGVLREDFETDKEVFFGEHLMQKQPNIPVAIVESEKTALIAAISKAGISDFLWLATGSKQWLKVHRLEKLGRDRIIVLYPDADGYLAWSSVASEAHSQGLHVKVSSLIEKRATDLEKRTGFDIADYLMP